MEMVVFGGLVVGMVKMNGWLFVYGFGVEFWGEFFNVVVFVCCFDDVMVGLF